MFIYTNHTKLDIGFDKLFIYYLIISKKNFQIHTGNPGNHFVNAPIIVMRMAVYSDTIYLYEFSVCFILQIHYIFDNFIKL